MEQVPPGGDKRASAASVVYDNTVEAPPARKREKETDSEVMDRTEIVCETFHR